MATGGDAVPALVQAAGRRAGARFVEFFTANIRNPNTRRKKSDSRYPRPIPAGCRGQLPQPLHTIARRREYGRIDERRFNHPFQPILKYVDITGKPEPRAIQGC